MGHNGQFDLSSLSSEMHLLLQLLGSVNTDGSETGVLEFHDVDWDHFLFLARHHRVAPEIHMIARRLELPVPARVCHALQKEHRNNMFRMLGLTAEMERVCRVLANRGIRTIVLKGPVLGFDLYGDVSLRMSGDVDILVPLEQLDEADRTLQDIGYVKDDYINTYLNDWKWRYHHVSYYHPEHRCKMEVHWRLHPGPAKEPGFETLWENRKPGALAPDTVYQLEDEDLFVFLAAHGARHGWSRLRWLTDIDRLCKKHDLDWDRIYLRSRRLWVDHLIGQALWLCAELLHTPVKEPFRLFMDSKRSRKLAEEAIFYVARIVNLHTPPLPADVSAFHQRHLFALMNVKQKGMYLMSTLLPCSADAELLPLPKPLRFLYIPLRPFLWAWRKAGGSA